MENQQFIRDRVANSQIMYCEAYTEHDESDIFDMLVAVEFVENDHGAECEFLAMIEFSSEIQRIEEGY